MLPLDLESAICRQDLAVRMDVSFNNVLEGARQYFQGLPSPVASNVDNSLYNSETAVSQPSASGSEINANNLTNSLTNSAAASASTLPSVTSSTTCSSSSTSTLSSGSNSSSLPYWSPQNSLGDKTFTKEKNQFLSVKTPSLSSYENSYSTVYNGNFSNSVDRRNSYQSQNHSQQQTVHTSQQESYTHHYPHVNQSPLPRTKGHNLPPIATISNRHGNRNSNSATGLLGTERLLSGNSLLTRKPEYSLPVDPKYPKSDSARYVDTSSSKSVPFNHYNQKYLQKQNNMPVSSVHASRSYSMHTTSTSPSVASSAPSTNLTSTQRPHLLPAQHNLPQVPLSIPQLQSQQFKHSQELHNHQQQQHQPQPPQHHSQLHHQQQQKKQLQYRQHQQPHQPHSQHQTQLAQHQQLIQHNHQQNQVVLQQQHLQQLQNQNQQQHQPSHQQHVHQQHLHHQSQLHPQLLHQQIHPPQNQVHQQQQVHQTHQQLHQHHHHHQQQQQQQQQSHIQQQSQMFHYMYPQAAQIDNAISQAQQKRDSADVHPSKAQSQHYLPDQTNNVIPAARTAGQTSISRVPNPPGSALTTSVLQNSKSVISVRGASIRSKRESPLDLSVKTVRQSADSTKDDAECGYNGSNASPCGDMVAVGGAMQSLGGETTGGALPTAQHSPMVPGLHVEKAGGLQNPMRGVPLPKADFLVNSGSQSSRPIPTSSYSVENQRLSMLKPGVQQQQQQQQQAHLSFQTPATSLPHMNSFRKSTLVNYNICESREQSRDLAQYKYSATKEATPYSGLPGASSYEESAKQNSVLNRKAEYVGIPATTDVKHEDISAGHKRVHEGRHGFPAKIPRKDTWHRTIDQQIEQKLSAYTRLQHQEQVKPAHGLHSYSNEPMESSSFQNYQSPSLNSNFSSAHCDDLAASVHHNGISRGSKHQYLPQLELNGDQHTIRKLLTSKSDPLVPSTGYSNSGSDSMLSILRSSLEIKEARISQLQNQLQQNAQMQHLRESGSTDISRSSTVMSQIATSQAHPGMPLAVHSGSVTLPMASHKLHVPKAVDSVLLDLEPSLESDASAGGCQQMQQIPHHYHQQKQHVHHHLQQQMQQQHQHHQMQQQLELQQQQTLPTDSHINSGGSRSGDFDKFAAYLAARIRTKAELKQVGPDVEKFSPFSSSTTAPQTGVLDTTVCNPAVGHTPAVLMTLSSGEPMVPSGSPPKLTRERGTVPRRKVFVRPEDGSISNTAASAASVVATGAATVCGGGGATAAVVGAVAGAIADAPVGAIAGAAVGATAGAVGAISALPIMTLQDGLGLRSSSETSVFDFRDSDSEGEMPVLERQTLYEMRRDRKLLTKVPSRFPVPSEAAVDEVVRDSRDLFVQGPASPSDAFWSSACDQFLEQLQAGSGTPKRGRKKKITGDVNTETVDEKFAKDGTAGDANTDDTIVSVKSDKEERTAMCSVSEGPSKTKESDPNEIKVANSDSQSEIHIDTNNKEITKEGEYQKPTKIKLEDNDDNQRNKSDQLGKISSKGELKYMKMCRKILKEEEINVPKRVHGTTKEFEDRSKVKDKDGVMKVGSEEKEGVRISKEGSSVLAMGRRRKWKRRKHLRGSQHTENNNEILVTREGKRSFRNENNKKNLEDNGPRMGNNRAKRKFKCSPRLNELKRLGKYKVLHKGQKDDSEEDIPLSKQRLGVRKAVEKEERDVDDEMSLAEMKAQLRKGSLNKRPMRRKVLRSRADDAESSRRNSSTSDSGDSNGDGVPQESVAARVHRRKVRNVVKTGMHLRPRNASSVPRNRKLCSQNSENSKKDSSSVSQSECKQFGDGSDFHPGWEEEVYKFKQSLRMPAQLINIPKPPSARHLSASLPDLDPSATSLLDSAGSQNSASSQQHSVCSDQNSNSNPFGSQLPYKTDDATESEDTNLSIVSSKNSSNIDNNNSVLNVFGQIGSNKYISKRILQKKCNKNSVIPRSSSTDLEASVLSETGISQHILGGKLKKIDILRGEAKVSLSKIECDNHDLIVKDRTKKKGAGTRDASNDGSKQLVENLALKSRTRTQTRLLQQRPTIRAVFGEDRPASAPPSCADTFGLLSENKRSTKAKKVIHPSVGVVTRGRAGLRTAAILRSNKAVLNSKRHLLHSNKTRNIKLLRAIANKKITTESANHFSSEPIVRLPQGPHNAHMNSSNKCLANTTSIGKRIKIRTVRRKFRSGFDYIRKKKKQQKKDTGDIEPLKERKKSIVSRPSSESVQDVQAEIRGWVINKGLGETLLHRAARLGYTDVAAYCLEKMDSAPSPQDNAGYTPLHEACSRGHLDIARLLLMYGADVSASALGGVRPLHEAAENGYTELVRLLLSYGADPLLATYSGVAPLALATDEGSRWLLQHHLADVQGLSATSWTFHGAASYLDPVLSGYDPLQDPPCASPDTGDEDEIDIEISEVSLPVLYQLRGEPVKERWVLFQDLAPLLRVKSRDVLLRQISSGPGTDFRSILRELKMADFLEQAHCCHVLGGGEKVNIRASKVALVKYNERVRELLGVEKITVSSR